MKVWKLGDLRITNENAIVFTKQASWRFERASVSTGLCRVKAECNCGGLVLSLHQALTDQ